MAHAHAGRDGTIMGQCEYMHTMEKRERWRWGIDVSPIGRIDDALTTDAGDAKHTHIWRVVVYIREGKDAGNRHTKTTAVKGQTAT